MRLVYVLNMSSSLNKDIIIIIITNVMQRDFTVSIEKVQVGKDQEKAQSEKDSHSKNRGGKKLTIRYLYHENTS